VRPTVRDRFSQSRALKVYLLGWFGRHNSGDDALCIMVLDALTKMPINLQTIICVPTGGQLPPLPDCVTRKTLHRHIRGYVWVERMLPVLYADAVLWGGGSIMSDVNPRGLANFRFQRTLCRIANLRRIPIIFSALGLGPLYSTAGRNLAREILNAATFVQVRDRQSLKLLHNLGVKTEIAGGFDPAVLLPEVMTIPVRHRDSRGEIATIGIALCQLSGTEQVSQESIHNKLDHLAEAIRRTAARREIKVVAIQMCANARTNDLFLCTQLLERLDGVCPRELIRYCPDPSEMMGRLSVCNVVLAERLHAAIYAYTLDIPLGIIPYHEKCRAFAEDIGLSSECVFSAVPTVNEVESFLEHALSGSPLARGTFCIRNAQAMARVGQAAVVKALTDALAVG
jgi:polysaccharide pyruvyl transferase WcaK-like protein